MLPYWRITNKECGVRGYPRRSLWSPHPSEALFAMAKQQHGAQLVWLISFVSPQYRVAAGVAIIPPLVTPHIAFSSQVVN